jgi:hypothetical protein
MLEDMTWQGSATGLINAKSVGFVLYGYQRACLQQFAFEINDIYQDLANNLYGYLDGDADNYTHTVNRSDFAR